MSFTVEKYPDEPIILSTYHESFDPSRDIHQVFKLVSQLADGINGPVYRIIDNRRLHLTFDKMTILMGEESQRKPGSISDPRLSTVIVTTSDLAQFGAKSMREQEQYGKHPLTLFTSLEEALAHVRAEIASREARRGASEEILDTLVARQGAS